MFDKKGVIVIENDGSKDEDAVMMDVLDAGADDFDAEEEYFEVLTSPDKFSEVREKLEARGFTFVSAEVEMVPQTTSRLENPEQAELMEKLINNLEDMQREAIQVAASCVAMLECLERQGEKGFVPDGERK
jgi:transcriptional/translational regulatory protein YebC/TACO1